MFNGRKFKFQNRKGFWEKTYLRFHFFKTGLYTQLILVNFCISEITQAWNCLLYYMYYEYIYVFVHLLQAQLRELYQQPDTEPVDENYFLYTVQVKMTKCSQKGGKIVYLFESTYPEIQRKHNIPKVYEYQSSYSSHMVDDWYQASTRKSSGWHKKSNFNQYSSGWPLMKNVFSRKQKRQVQSKRCKKFIPFLVYIPWNAKKTYT